jgi:hypothetical protein
MADRWRSRNHNNPSAISTEKTSLTTGTILSFAGDRARSLAVRAQPPAEVEPG